MSKYLKKQPKKPFRFSLRPLCTFAVWLMLFSLVSTGVTYGKYQSSATASDTATVASFSVSASGSTTNDKIQLEARGSAVGTYTLKVYNSSDVPIETSVTLTGVPYGVEVSLNGESAIAGQNGIVVLSDYSDNIINAKTGSTAVSETYYLYFDASGCSNDANSTVTVSVKADQAQ